VDTKTLTASGAHADGDMSPGGHGVQSLRRTLSYYDLVIYGLAYVAPFGLFQSLGFVWQASNGLARIAGPRCRRMSAPWTAAEWFGADVLSAYLLFKRAEIKGLENLDESEICRRYAEVY
jgi:hypothetical protein